MLSYQHAYHAGNHADILKHITLSLVLEYMLKKDKPFTVIDTHAGEGLYSLNDEKAVKTNEAYEGIVKFLSAVTQSEIQNNYKQPVALIESFLKICRTYTDKGLYPGSPEIERCFLRSQDEQILSELHPQAIDKLRAFSKQINLINTDTQIKTHIHFRDGYETFKSCTPPKTKRGVVIIDPSYEDQDDYSHCADNVINVYNKWSNGVYLIWYPLVEHRSFELRRMKEVITSCVEAKNTEQKILDLTLEVSKPQDMTGLSKLYGSGMLIINPPYELDKKMEQIVPLLAKVLSK